MASPVRQALVWLCTWLLRVIGSLYRFMQEEGYQIALTTPKLDLWLVIQQISMSHVLVRYQSTVVRPEYVVLAIALLVWVKPRVGYSE